jgi:hypothetical protein
VPVALLSAMLTMRIGDLLFPCIPPPEPHDFVA